MLKKLRKTDAVDSGKLARGLRSGDLRSIPDEEKEIAFTVDKAALSFYDNVKKAWIAEDRDFEALIGSSAVDIRCILPFN